MQFIIGALIGGVTLYLFRKYFKGGVCYSDARLDGKTVIVTGCNTGLGKETARDISRRGARVIMACRNLQKANEAAKEIREDTKGEVVVYELKLDSFKSVRKCAEEILGKEEKIDILINNAGVMMCPYTKTEDGFEMQFGTNHLGHFLFTNLLLDKIKSTGEPARIVNLSSMGHKFAKMDMDDLNFEKKPYDSTIAYGNSKLANILFTKELANRLSNTKITTYAVHPGGVDTELGRHLKDRFGKLFFGIVMVLSAFFIKTPVDGAQTSIYCAVDPALSKATGKYYSDCKEKEPQKTALDQELAKKLWDYSVKAVGL